MIRRLTTRSGILAAAEEMRQALEINPRQLTDFQRIYPDHEEPELSVPGLDLGPGASLTVNQYGAVILNARYMLITDTDFRSPDSETTELLLARFGELDSFDEFWQGESLPFRYSDQSYRLYRTHSGYRMICTSMPVEHAPDPWDAASNFLEHFGSDREYVRMCRRQGCFRARLTPKPWRVKKGQTHHVCELIHEIGNEMHGDLEEQLRVHDMLTLPVSGGSVLA